jgi:hypothetical protein
MVPTAVARTRRDGTFPRERHGDRRADKKYQELQQRIKARRGG